MTGKPQYEIKSFLKVIPGTGGLYSEIARRLKINRKTAADYCKKFPELVEAIKQEEESIIDEAEGGLFYKIKRKDQWAIGYFLARKGKHRGYVERTEQDHQHGASAELIDAIRAADAERNRKTKK